MPTVLKSVSLNLLEPSGPVQGCNGTALHDVTRPFPVLLTLVESTTYEQVPAVLRSIQTHHHSHIAASCIRFMWTNKRAMLSKLRVCVCVCVCVCRLLHSEDSETCRLNIPVSSFQPTTNRGFVKHWGKIHLFGRHGIVSRRVAEPVACNAETHAAAVTFRFFLLSFQRLFVLRHRRRRRRRRRRRFLLVLLLLLLPLSSYFVTKLNSSFLCCTFYAVSSRSFHSSPFLSSALIRSNDVLRYYTHSLKQFCRSATYIA